MKLIVIPLPEEEWNKPSVAQAVEDIMICCRRISKKVDLATERRRFAKASDLIETVALDHMRKRNANYLELDNEEAIMLLNGLERVYSTCTPSFIHPDRIGEFLNCVKLKKIAHLRWERAGFVVILSPFENVPASSPLPIKPHKNEKDNQIQPVSKDAFLNDNDCCSNEELIKKIQEKILEAINAERPFNASAYGHEGITETLRTAIYAIQSPTTFQGFFARILSKSSRVQFLRISYDDGSAGGLFPLFSLKKLEIRPECSVIIKLGLMSIRHSESLDVITDGYLIRNSEMNWQDSYGEQEWFAHQQMMKLVDALLEIEHSVEIHLYHTGLQPAVVGVYRAVVDQLKNHRGRVIVVPYFARGGDGFTEVCYVPSEAWY
ncbi:MAG: hypothetical protein GX837_12475 [Methanomicrobiales archaeon]|nr:hypothetical protein [Methanomicrobiales archaeon]